MKKTKDKAQGAGRQSSRSPLLAWLGADGHAYAVLCAALALLSMWLLAINGANLLRKIELLSYFAPTGMYLHDCLALPGGLMVWLSTLLTQTFYHPWLGAVVYTALLLGMAWVATRALCLRGQLRPLALALGAMTLLALLCIGYTIFSLKSPGYAFNLPIGLTCALLGVWGYRKISTLWLRAVAIAVMVSAGYCLTGYYGLLAGGLSIIIELTRACTVRRQRWAPLVAAAVGAAAIWGVPQMWFGMIGGDLIIKQIYLCPLPLYIDGEGDLWRPYNVIFLLMALMAVIAGLPQGKLPVGRPALGAASAAVAVLAMALCVVMKNDDPNLRLTLALDHALQQGDWDQALSTARSAQDIEPTRVNVVLTYMALLRNGVLGDSLYKFRVASAPYETARHVRATHDIVSRMFTYHTGLANFAYRMGMEYKVEYGTSVEHLQFMAKAALLNGDLQLARKALDNLRLTAFHKDWADHYYRYVEHPEMMAEDPELGSIMPLLNHYQGFMTDRGRMESFVWNFLANTPNSNKESLELALCGAMISQDMRAFSQALPYYASLTHGVLPEHIQEGVLAWQSIDDNFDIRPYRIDPGVQKRFDDFMEASKMYSQLGEQKQKEMLQARFGDTFWYYYLFVDNLIIY